jgi:hypothetical protein
MPWDSANLPLFSETRRTLLQIPHWPRHIWLANKDILQNGQQPLPSDEDEATALAAGTPAVVSAVAVPLLQPNESIDLSETQKECGVKWMKLLNSHLYQFIFQHTSDAAQRIALQHPNDGYGAFQRLKHVFKRNSYQYKNSLISKLDNLEIPSFGNPREAIQTITDLLGRLQQNGIIQNDEILRSKIMNKLSAKSYKDLKTQFEQKLQERKELTPFQMLQQVQSYWQNHDTHFKEANQADKEANNVKRKIANNASQEVPKKQRTGNASKCTFCGKTNHTADMCFKNVNGKNYRKPSVKQTQNQNTKQNLNCTKCNRKGHLAKDCYSKSVKSKANIKNGLNCTKCNKPNHEAKDCFAVPCEECGYHYNKSQNHPYNNCGGDTTGHLGSVQLQISTMLA